MKKNTNMTTVEGDVKNPNISILDLCRVYITQNENAKSYGKKLNPNTIRHHKNFYNHLQNFLGSEKRIDLKAVEFKKSFAIGFFDYLINLGNSNNFCIKVVAFTRAALDFGVREEIIYNHRLANFSLSKEPPKDIVALNGDELKNVIDYIPNTKELEKTRLMFIFQCMTGFDYGDTCSVSKNNITYKNGILFFEKKRLKNNNMAVVPVMALAKKLFEQNNYSMKLLPNQTYNQQLKILATNCNIYKHLTSHVGRKTFAMILLNEKNITIESISKALGHSSIKTTVEYYAKVNTSRIANEFITQRLVELVKRA